MYLLLLLIFAFVVHGAADVVAERGRLSGDYVVASAASTFTSNGFGSVNNVARDGCNHLGPRDVPRSVSFPDSRPDQRVMYLAGTCLITGYPNPSGGMLATPAANAASGVSMAMPVQSTNVEYSEPTNGQSAWATQNGPKYASEARNEEGCFRVARLVSRFGISGRIPSEYCNRGCVFATTPYVDCSAPAIVSSGSLLSFFGKDFVKALTDAKKVDGAKVTLDDTIGSDIVMEDSLKLAAAYYDRISLVFTDGYWLIVVLLVAAAFVQFSRPEFAVWRLFAAIAVAVFMLLSRIGGPYVLASLAFLLVVATTVTAAGAGPHGPYIGGLFVLLVSYFVAVVVDDPNYHLLVLGLFLLFITVVPYHGLRSQRPDDAIVVVYALFALVLAYKYTVVISTISETTAGLAILYALPSAVLPIGTSQYLIPNFKRALLAIVTCIVQVWPDVDIETLTVLVFLALALAFVGLRACIAGVHTPARRNYSDGPGLVLFLFYAYVIDIFAVVRVIVGMFTIWGGSVRARRQFAADAVVTFLTVTEFLYGREFFLLRLPFAVVGIFVWRDARPFLYDEAAPLRGFASVGASTWISTKVIGDLISATRKLYVQVGDKVLTGHGLLRRMNGVTRLVSVAHVIDKADSFGFVVNDVGSTILGLSHSGTSNDPLASFLVDDNASAVELDDITPETSRNVNVLYVCARDEYDDSYFTPVNRFEFQWDKGVVQLHANLTHGDSGSPIFGVSSTGKAYYVGAISKGTVDTRLGNVGSLVAVPPPLVSTSDDLAKAKEPVPKTKEKKPEERGPKPRKPGPPGPKATGGPAEKAMKALGDSYYNGTGLFKGIDDPIAAYVKAADDLAAKFKATSPSEDAMRAFNEARLSVKVKAE